MSSHSAHKQKVTILRASITHDTHSLNPAVLTPQLVRDRVPQLRSRHRNSCSHRTCCYVELIVHTVVLRATIYSGANGKISWWKSLQPLGSTRT